jgi:hypothetical protein
MNGDQLKCRYRARIRTTQPGVELHFGVPRRRARRSADGIMRKVACMYTPMPAIVPILHDYRMIYSLGSGTHHAKRSGSV